MHMMQTTGSPEISIVVPLFNEEESVAILQTELSAALKGLDYETIFVDDGSVDRTAEQIETAPNIRLIRFEKNSGQSAAIYAGLTAARGRTVVIIPTFQNCSLKLRAVQILFAAIASSAGIHSSSVRPVGLQTLYVVATRKTGCATPVALLKRCGASA